MHTNAVSANDYINFATSAVDNLIALYDIRTPRYCIARYSGHVNRRDAVQCAFSPCLRYLATGSEDRSIRIIDIRGAFRELAKVSFLQKDTVCDVAFNPLFPQLASCSYDGSVKFCTEAIV